MGRDILDKIPFIFGLTYALFILFYFWLLVVCIWFEPMLKSLGVSFHAFMFPPGELIMLFVIRVSFIGFGVMMALLFKNNFAIPIYLSGFLVLFICFLIYSPARLTFHRDEKLYFWINWIGEFIPRESHLYSCIFMTLLILGYQIIPYGITFGIRKLVEHLS